MSQALKTPNIYRNEKDQSEVTAPAGTSVGAMVMSARQGVANQRVNITNDKQLVDLFGIPVPDGEDVGILGGIQFLKESDSLWVVRATSGSEKYANISVTASNVTASNGSGVTAQKTSDLLIDMPDGNTNEKIFDVDGARGTASMIIACKGPGSYGNSIAVTLVTSANGTLVDWNNKYDVSISGSVFKLSVYQIPTGSTLTSASTPDEVFYGSTVYQQDGAGAQLFIKDVVNGKSQFIYVDVAENAALGQIIGSQNAPVALAGGANSNTTFQASSASIIAGWGLFTDKTKVTINILIDTYKTSNTVAPTVASVAESRLDCIASLQAGDVDDVTVANILSSFPTVSIPSYSAIYAAWDKVYDNFNDRNVYIPKCVYGAVIMARTDRIANTWDAPAGVNRGILPSIGQNIIFSDTDIGNLYDANINTSRFIRGTGNVLWGQKTAQRKKSALDRINVRRLLLYIENSVEPSLVPFLFENNNSKVRLRAFNSVDSFMKTILAGGGVTKYEVVCDETNNTAQVIDSNEMVLDVYLQPTKTIEFIRLNIIVTRTGVNFSEIR